MEELNARRVAFVHDRTEYGSNLASLLADRSRIFAARTAVQVALEAEQQDFSPLVQLVGDAESDAIYFAGTASVASKLKASPMAAQLIRPVLASDQAILTSDIDEEYGAYEGLFFCALAPCADVAAEEDWIEAYREVARRVPGSFSFNGYVEVRVLAAGVGTAKSFQGRAIAQAIREIEIESLFGQRRFRTKGNGTDARFWICKVEEGDFRQLD